MRRVKKSIKTIKIKIDTPQSLKKKSSNVPTLKLSKPVETDEVLNTKVKSIDKKTKLK